MDKQDILKNYKNQEDKMLLAQIIDKINQSKASNLIESTDFLDMYQISLAETFLKKIRFENYKFFGGFGDAERKILFISNPDLEIEKQIKENLSVVRIILPKQDEGKFAHRNYLGGIIKLGLKREKIGDILVSNDGADIITQSIFASILQKELLTLKRFENAKIEVLNIDSLRVKPIELKEIQIIVPSMRLDNFVSDLVRTSRNKSLDIIKQERVFINGKSETKPAKQVKINDIITIRGKGRFIVKEILGNTRSGRTIVKIETWN